jgi:uncharacterized protein (TIRG00374 family)
MPKKLLSYITYLLTLGLGVFLIWLSVKGLKPHDVDLMKDAISKANFWLLIPILIMGFVSHWSRAIRWRYLMEPLNLSPSKSNAFFAVMVGYLANLAFPRLGEVLKCTILAKYENIPADKLIGTIIAERAFDLLCLLIIFFLTFLVQIDFAKELLQGLQAKQSGQGSGHLLYYLIGTFVVVGFLFAFRHRIANLAFFQKIREIAKNVLAGIMSFKKMKHKKEFVFHTLLIWGMYMGMIVLGFQSIAATSHLGINAGFSVLSFGSVGMIVTPGGLGAYTGLVEKIVSLYGVEKAFAVAISWIIWLVPTLIIIIGGGISMMLLPFFNQNKTHAK